MKCQEKNRYSRKTAQKVRREILFKKGIRLYIYKCYQCNSLHLTKKRLDKNVAEWLAKSKKLD